MNWYIVQAYSGFEKKVVEAIKEELKKNKLQDNLGEILVPTHQVTEVKKGKRTKKEKKFFPGYVLIKIELSSKNYNDSSYDGRWSYSPSIDESIKGSHCVVIITEWHEFTLIDWENVSKEMLRPAWVFDTRGIINLKDVKSNSLRFWSIGNGNN